jgi:hypothetical protein
MNTYHYSGLAGAVRRCWSRVGGVTQVQIQGSSGVALASGLHWYLKYSCNCSVSWGVAGSGNNLALPSVPPAHPPTLRRLWVVNSYRGFLTLFVHSGCPRCLSRWRCSHR